MKVLIPMGGRGRRFRQAGYTTPKPLLPVQGRPILAHLLQRFPPSWPRVLLCHAELLADPAAAATLAAVAPDARIVAVAPHERGPVHTVLAGLQAAPDILGAAEPCIVNYCDFDFRWDPHDFEAFTERTGCAGAVVCYTGFHPEYLRPTLYAYCRESAGRLLDIREKGHFTPDRTREYASSGTYYFARGDLLRQSFERLMAEGPLQNGEGYVSLVFKHLLAAGLPCRVYEIPYFLQWGTPEDFADYAYWAGVYERYPYAGLPPDALPADTVLIPMAGRGARFAGETPKPLREVQGSAMFQAALAHLPAAGRPVLVVRDAFAPAVRQLASTATLVSLAGVTAGQAITCRHGATALDPAQPVLVSNCDHGLVFDPAAWQALRATGPDCIVVGQRGYPGAERTPRAFAYIATADDGVRVTGVSVKQPLSPTPRNDLLLVGTFWFRTAGLMTALIDELEAHDLRVNGEFYLDSVVGLAVARGLDVRAFAADGYLCWGTPEALSEAQYWHAFFTGKGRP